MTLLEVWWFDWLHLDQAVELSVEQREALLERGDHQGASKCLYEVPGKQRPGIVLKIHKDNKFDVAMLTTVKESKTYHKSRYIVIGPLLTPDKKTAIRLPVEERYPAILRKKFKKKLDPLVSKHIWSELEAIKLGRKTGGSVPTATGRKPSGK